MSYSEEDGLTQRGRRPLSGDPVELPPAIHPNRAVLSGPRVALEPVDPRRHAEGLFEAGHPVAGVEDLWRYMPYGPFPDRAAFTAWQRGCAATADPGFYAVRDLEQSRLSGMASFLTIRPAVGSIEIGHIWFAPFLQRTPQATEALYLMMRHAMDDLGYRRLEWKCNALNAASRSAARRLGFRYEGTFYNHLIVKGLNRDTAWYSITAEEWPAVRRNLERWLSPLNFDDAGHQRTSLSDLNRALW